MAMLVSGSDREDLSGRAFMFDYGEIAKFLLRFTACRTVEVTLLEANLYSVSHADTFAVETTPMGGEVYRICWDDPVEQTHLSHVADFRRLLTAVVIEDHRLDEVRHYEGAIFGA